MTQAASRSGPTVALLSLAALAAFCAFHWANLLVDPPILRVAAVVAIAVATAAALDMLAAHQRSRWATAALAALATLAGIAAGLIAAGLPARLLAPWNWDELGAGISLGIAGLGGATYPYQAGGEWPRLVLVCAIPAVLVAVAAISFWPGGRHRALRAVGLAILVCAYGTAAVLYAPGSPALHGAALLALVAFWLWGEEVRRDGRGVTVAMLVAAGALALPLSSAIARSEPVIDYRSWSWTGGEPSVSFDWDHSYDPLEWPREGTALLEIESEVPHYWRSVVLERFDGYRWVRDESAASALELPSKVEGQYSIAHSEWLETTGVTVRELRSGLVVGPGSVQGVAGLEGSIEGDGTVLAGEIPDSGERYEVTSYAPDPSAEQLAAADAPYPPVLSRFTTLELPTSRVSLPGLDLPQLEGRDAVPAAITPVVVPLRGNPAGSALQRIDRSGYGGVARLARELVAGAPGNYEAVRAVEAHFQSGFTYSEEAATSERPLRSFLLETRTGYCQQYSGAMALMLRMVGIPARVVSGFSPGAPDLDRDGVFTVRDTDAHSWVEVYFTGIGWVPFDPTPTAAPAELQSDPAAAAATPQRSPDSPGGRAREPEARGGLLDDAGSSGGGIQPLALLALVFATAVAAGVATARRRARFDSAPRAARLRAQVVELTGALEAARYRPGGGSTLLALERRLRDGGRTATAAYLGDLRSCLYAARPGAQPGLHERRAARRDLGRSRGLRQRLRLIAALPPGGPRIPSSDGG